jgi:hypothetical protein
VRTSIFFRKFPATPAKNDVTKYEYEKEGVPSSVQLRHCCKIREFLSEQSLYLRGILLIIITGTL